MKEFRCFEVVFFFSKDEFKLDNLLNRMGLSMCTNVKKKNISWHNLKTEVFE